MEISAIRKLLKVDPSVLRKAEEDIAEERIPELAVDGKDEGEKLTHIYGAIWIQEQVAAGSMDEKTALRAFFNKVRESIS